MGSPGHADALRADEVWLEGLASALADRRYDALQSHLIRNANQGTWPLRHRVPGATEEQIARGVLVHLSSREDSLLSFLFERCLRELDENGGGSAPDHLFFLQLPIPTLNGFAIQTPSLRAPA